MILETSWFALIDGALIAYTILTCYFGYKHGFFSIFAGFVRFIFVCTAAFFLALQTSNLEWIEPKALQYVVIFFLGWIVIDVLCRFLLNISPKRKPKSVINSILGMVVSFVKAIVVIQLFFWIVGLGFIDNGDKYVASSIVHDILKGGFDHVEFH